jgi:dihydroxyacetone kinase phosphotransfer subunit
LIGLVLVSHSRRLAEGLQEMLVQIANASVPVALAAGTEDGRLGTNPLRVRDAIREVLSEDGVLVLVDIGSSVLAVEMAIEMLTPRELALVSISEGPFVEGAVVAAVQARIGTTLAKVTEASNSAGALPKLPRPGERDTLDRAGAVMPFDPLRESGGPVGRVSRKTHGGDPRR